MDMKNDRSQMAKFADTPLVSKGVLHCTRKESIVTGSESSNFSGILMVSMNMARFAVNIAFISMYLRAQMWRWYFL